MRQFNRIFSGVAALCLVIFIAATGVLAPVDEAVRDVRFKFASRAPSGDIVFLAIDPLSLQDVGIWPWPRSIHGDVIDELLRYNVSDIFIDIDFSSVSNETEDAKLAASLERAGGFVGLAAFAQLASVSSNELIANLPLKRFSDQAETVVVNVKAEQDGDVRSYPLGQYLGDELFPSVASFLNARPAKDESFFVDFGIDASLVDQISISDLLWGEVDPARLADKQVVIGASALELRDTLAVPRFGAMPGALLQILAAETVKQNRMLVKPGAGITILLAIGLFILVLSVREWRGLGTALAIGVAYGVGIEAGALGLQAHSALLIDTFASHLGLVLIALLGSAQEIDFRNLMLKRSARDIAHTQSILNRVIEDNFDGVIVIGRDGEIFTASRFAETFFGFKASKQGPGADAVLPKALMSSVRSAFQLEHARVIQKDIYEAEVADSTGAQRTIEYVLALSRPDQSETTTDDSEIACLTFRDVTERKAQERRLRYVAEHDSLTGALSRTRFIEMLAEAQDDDAHEDEGVTVFLIDLTRFKAVNDTLGHDNGDALLRQVARRIETMDFLCVARMGGDGFAAMLRGELDGADLDATCAALIDKLSQVYLLGEHHAIVGARVGVTTRAISGTDPQTLIAHADMALSSAKKERMSGHACYTPDMSARLTKSIEMEMALGNALARSEFFLEYQPQVDIDTGKLIGAEALARWQNEKLGRVRPDHFIGLAEETGLILPLGKWVLMTACREAMSWADDLHISVNISPVQFAFGDVVGDVREALQRTGLAPERLEVEITESLLISNADSVIQALEEIRSMGVTVALDDFGTGFSSLSYLGKLPIDKIKIDQSFVRGLPADTHSAAVINAVMTLSQSLDMLVVAEGIETKDQAALLNIAGCQIGQGYYYGKPMKGQDVLALHLSDQLPDARQVG